MNDLTDLARHWMRQTQIGKGLRLTGDQLDMLNGTSVGRLIRMVAADDGVDPIVPPACTCCDPIIYFIQSGERGPIKIGSTKKPAQRRTEHQTGNPRDLTIIAQFHAPLCVERQLQKHFRPEWIRGEWFHPSPRLLRFAERCTS